MPIKILKLKESKDSVWNDWNRRRWTRLYVLLWQLTMSCWTTVILTIAAVWSGTRIPTFHKTATNIITYTAEAMTGNKRHYTSSRSSFNDTKAKISPQNSPWRRRGGVSIQRCSFFNIGDWWGWVVNAAPPPLYSRQREPVPIVKEDRYIPTAGLDGRGKSCTHRDSIPEPSINIAQG